MAIALQPASRMSFQNLNLVSHTYDSKPFSGFSLLKVLCGWPLPTPHPQPTALGPHRLLSASPYDPYSLPCGALHGLKCPLRPTLLPPGGLPDQAAFFTASARVAESVFVWSLVNVGLPQYIEGSLRVESSNIFTKE